MDTDAAIDEAEKQLIDLAAGTNIEEMITQSKHDPNDDNDDNDIDDYGQELEISTKARAQLNASVRPVKLVLVKASPLHLLLCGVSNMMISFEKLHLQ